MRFANKAIVAGGLGFAVSALVGCGSTGGLLSAEQASNLNNQLEQVAVAVNNRQCGDVDTAVAALNRSVAGLGSVNQTLVSNLEQGVQTVGQLADQNCRGIFRTTPTTTTTPTTPTTTTTKTTPTTTTTNTTPTTAPTAPVTITPTAPVTTTPTTPVTTTPTTPVTTTPTTPANTTGGTGLGGAATTGATGAGGTAG
jgi:hypothetical protein